MSIDHPVVLHQFLPEACRRMQKCAPTRECDFDDAIEQMICRFGEGAAAINRVLAKAQHEILGDFERQCQQRFEDLKIRRRGRG